MKRCFSLILAVILFGTMLPQGVLKVNAVEPQSARFVYRNDGVWLWPTTYYAISDWAGCNASPNTNSYCYFCGVQHGLCGANHLTTLGHNGIDIPVGMGTEVYAAAPGTLYCTNTDWDYRGITAVVEHPISGSGWSYYSIYQHLQSTVTAKNGTTVNAGEVIAWSGNTDGFGTGQAHLHFGIVMGTSGQGNALAQNPNSNISAIENCGWLTIGGYATGRILPNPALNSPAGTPTYTDGCENNVRTHAGSVMYTRKASEVSIGTTCVHSYVSEEITATCTTDGVRTYTCSKCGDSYTENIPATGHSYSSKVIAATCVDYEKTVYTCDNCGETYSQYNDGAVSEWSTTKPSGVDETKIETQIQYRYRVKEYTTSTESSMDGWTWIDTTYSDWGDAQTTPQKPVESDLLRITATAQTGWGYYHYCNYYSGCWNIDSIPCGTGNYYHSYISTFALPTCYIADQGGQQSYGGTGSGAQPCNYNFYIWFRNPSTDTYKYTYETRSLTNRFYKWSEWSEWSASPVVQTDDCEVETRTVYRYVTGELGDHDFQNGVCTVCGVVECYQPLNGLSFYDGVWGYYIDGILQTGFTDLVLYEGNFFYVQNGILSFDYTGLVLYMGNYYYVENSVLNWGYTGLTLYNGVWYYVQNGQLVWGYYGLVCHNGAWYYVENSAITFTYTGLVEYMGNWYYVEGSCINWGYSSLYLHNGTWYVIQGGQLIWGYYGLVCYNDLWFYAENSMITFTFTGLAEYQGILFYFEGSCLNWSYNGKATYNGVEYDVVNGMAFF